MHWSQYVLPLVFCSLTGWLICFIGIKLIFHPFRPLYIFGAKLQGILPANKERIIRQVTDMASKELSSLSLEEKISDPAQFEKLKPEIEKHIDVFLREKLKHSFPLISSFIGDKTINKLKSSFITELETLFPVLIKKYTGQLTEEFDPIKLISSKLEAFFTQKALATLEVGIKKETRLLQLFGLLTGLCMGLIQLLLQSLLI